MSSLFLQFLRNLLRNPFFVPTLLVAVLVYKTLAPKSITSKVRPPSPRKLPVIGNLHQLGPSLHRSFQSLSRQYGKLMLLHLGHKPTLVVSSVDATREITKTHDAVFCSRPKSLVVGRIFYGYKDVAFAPYGEHWRQMRSISVLHLLSKQKVQSFRAIREAETALTIDKILSTCNTSVVNLTEFIMSFTNDVICWAAFGKKCNGESGDGSVIFKKLLHDVMELLMTICLGDFVPCLSWVDRLKGLHGRVNKVANELDEFLEKVIQEHRHDRRPSMMMNTNDVECEEVKKEMENIFVDILLEYRGENNEALPLDNIKAVILNMFIAGTETTYTLIEWAMCELIRHPKVMKELREEVGNNGGRGHRTIREDDLEKLTYLKAVIKEALRLHPPAPLLAFRKASQDLKVNGFDIDAGTQPEEFRPERFLTGNSAAAVNFMGLDSFEYIPFGSGRRICPGISFATVNAELLVANLISEFDWELPGGGPECGKLDMAESVGLTVHKRDPLMVIATPSR